MLFLLQLLWCYNFSQFLKVPTESFTMWKVSKYEVFSGLYFPVFGLNTGKYESLKTRYLDTFHAIKLKYRYKTPKAATAFVL